jgi:outer membrane biosynthesis protein TonB
MSAWTGYAVAIMRYLPILLATFALMAGQPSFSAPKSDPPGKAVGAERRAGPAKPAAGKPPDPPGQAKKEEPKAKPEPPGQAKKDEPKPAPPGQAKKNESPASTKTKKAPVSDQVAAQRAVEQKLALPLSKIVAIAGERRAGKVINARLLRIDSVLLYQLTMLDGGHSWREYYNAATGNPVVIP